METINFFVTSAPDGADAIGLIGMEWRVIANLEAHPAKKQS